MYFASKYCLVQDRKAKKKKRRDRKKNQDKGDQKTNKPSSTAPGSGGGGDGESTLSQGLALMDAFGAPSAPQRRSGGRSDRRRLASLLEHRRQERMTRRKEKEETSLQDEDEDDLWGSDSESEPEADTNVLAIRFGTLATSADDVATGDAVQCSKCSAVLSSLSVLTKDAPKDSESKDELGDDEYYWSCEFCGKDQRVFVDEEQKIGKDVSTVDYILIPAPKQDDEEGKKEPEEKYVIYCIDTSGSMCVTSRIPKKIKLKGMEVPDLSAFGGDVYIPQTNDTWVGRLDCLKVAVDNQIKALSKDEPKTKVGIVTFNSDVQVVGDGFKDVTVVAGKKLGSNDALQEETEKLGDEAVSNPISESYDRLESRIFEMKAEGQTALGPALKIATELASAKRGSSVVVCTDGIANVGVGALEGGDDNYSQWYEEIGQVARDAGVQVNIVSFDDTECQLADIGVVAEATGGEVDRMKPIEMVEQWVKAARASLATNVKIKFILHSGLTFRNLSRQDEGESSETNQGEKKGSKDDKDTEEDDINSLERNLGSVFEDTEVFFEYTNDEDVDPEKFAKDMKDGLPFQVQIEFTALNGMKALRVISARQQVTVSQEQAEKDVAVDIVSANVAQQAAVMARSKKFSKARRHNYQYCSLLNRVAKSEEQREVFDNFLGHINKMDDAIVRNEVAALEEELGVDDDEEEGQMMDMLMQESRSSGGGGYGGLKGAMLNRMSSLRPSAAPSAPSSSLSRGRRQRAKKKKSSNRLDDSSYHIFQQQSRFSSSVLKKKAPKKK